ncbi:putative ribonuclease H-like domain-containing protein [Tanacetum coccineum]
MTHPHLKRRFVPQEILTKSGKLKTVGTLINTVRPVNTTDSKPIVKSSRPISNAFKRGHSQAMRPFNNLKTMMVDLFPLETVKVEFMEKGIKREFSVARTPQQNGVAERKNRTLIEAARTMLVDSKLPTTFWAEVVNTACYVLNRVLVIKPHNKTPYELIYGRPPLIDFMKPFGKAMRVFNKRTRIVEETLNIRFLENAPNVEGNGPDWLFDVDSLTISMNYVPVFAKNQTSGLAGTKDNIDASPKNSKENDGKKPTEVDESRVSDNGRQDDQATSYTPGPSFANVAPSSPINAAGTPEEHLFQYLSPFRNAFTLPHVPNVSSLDNTRIFGNAYDDEDVEEEVDMNNMISSYSVPDAPFTKFHKDHPENQIIGNLPRDKWAIGTKWVFRNKKDERGIVVKNKARLVAQGHTQEEGIDYDEVFALVVYVDDIIFGLTKKELSTKFEKLMHDKFQMSSMGELSFFLGLQVQQKSDGIFISQEKYVAEILKKFDFATVKTASTPIKPNKALIKDKEAEDVDVHLYISMIGSLMYLKTSRPNVTFVVCACARFQVTLKTSHLHVVKRIFRYLKGQPKLGLWYPSDSPFDLEAFSDSDYAGASLDRKSTTGAENVTAANCCGQATKISQSSGPTNLVADETIYKEREDKMKRAATIASSLKVEQDSCSGPRCQDTILGDVDAQTWFETVSKKSNDPPLSRVYTLRSREDSMKLKELMALFWQTTVANTLDFREVQITATIDGKVKFVSEASIRRHLKLEDSNGISTLPNTEIFEQLTLIGYASSSDKLTF